MDSVNFLNLEYIFLRIADFFRDFDLIVILNALIRVLYFFLPFALTIGALAILIILYSYVRLKVLDQEAHVFIYGHRKGEDPVVVEKGPESDDELASKWKEIQGLVNSTNVSDWRLAILEADIMLDAVLEKMGVQGDSIGDKLKSIDKGDLPNIQNAWEAHLVRNQIAHEGSDFRIDQREAKRIIGLYESVFSHFYHI